MRRLIALPVLLAGASASAQPEPYRALGTEPFWSLSIGRDTMRLDRADRPPVSVAAPVPRPSFNGMRYVTALMTVDVTQTPCSDGMSDRRYRDTVTVQYGRQTLRGCGGAPAPVAAQRLESTRWSIAAIDGRRVRLDRPTSVRFTGSRIEGRAGCNGFGANYAFRGGQMIVAPVIATRMACDREAMRVENGFHALVAEPLRVRWEGRRTVTLYGRRGYATLVMAP